MSGLTGTRAGIFPKSCPPALNAPKICAPCLPLRARHVEQWVGQGARYGRGLYLRFVLALLGISLCLTLPAKSYGATNYGASSQENSPPIPTPLSGLPRLPDNDRAPHKGPQATGPKSVYTGTVSPSTTATLTSQRPLFSAFATASLPFGGLIHQDCVFAVARSAAYLEALHEVALSLTKHTAALIGAYEMPRRMALAMAAYSPAVNKSVTSLPAPAPNRAPKTEGATPPENIEQNDEILTVLVTLEAPLHVLESRLRQTMQHPDTWELYATALQQMQSAVQEGRELITRAATLRNTHGGHMDAAFMSRTTHLADQLDALWMYVRILPNLRSLWDNPAVVQKQMQRALNLAPRHPLLWCALGESQLQMDLPQKALDSLNTALKFAPDLARALYARGVAHLRLQQSALAENDLTAALNLQPQTVHWLRARGAVRMVREEYGPMCEDFLAACALGDCDGLITARKRDLCLPAPQTQPATESQTKPAAESQAAPQPQPDTSSEVAPPIVPQIELDTTPDTTLATESSPRP